jgi:L-seryl-tRNA(Ser) seleniumtransferase
MAEVYRTLGISPVINASGTLTRLGGSRMPPAVVAAMADAAGSFVDLVGLQRLVGERIASLTRNEACYVSSGAAAGIAQSVAACIAGSDPERLGAFPQPPEPREVVVFASQRNGYDYAARMTGARLVEVNDEPGALGSAITDRTACILWFAGAHYAAGALPLAEVVATARPRRVPVLVDAAAQIPPVASLWQFTREIGADIAIFSGGKGLRGPQSAGLVLGRRDIVEACRLNGSPNFGFGRPMKVGKEELVGMLAAVEWTLSQDEAGQLAGYEASVERWIMGLEGIPGVSAERGYPSEAGQPHGRTIVHFSAPCKWSGEALATALWEMDPRIAVDTVTGDGIALNPQTLEVGEDVIVLNALLQFLVQQPDDGVPAGFDGNAREHERSA